jgi:hypothetical protein
VRIFSILIITQPATYRDIARRGLCGSTLLREALAELVRAAAQLKLLQRLRKIKG